ncbi:MAG: CapA family protein [Oscillospiraceae bacterium]|nr:CapA family protein [Oscillospiraceae bacterium]
MKKVTSIIITAAIFLSACTDISNNTPNEGVMQSSSLTQTTITEKAEPVIIEPPVAEPPTPEYITVSFVAAGDNLIHPPIYNQAKKHANGTDAEYDFTESYISIADIIGSADLSVINQETLICNDIYPPSNFPFFNSPVALGDHMIDIGFNVFSLANNHTLDKGMEGLYACLDYWDSRTSDSVVAVGAYRNAEDRANIRTSVVNDVTFSYLSYAESLNGLESWLKPPAEVGDANDVATMINEITRAGEISDVCVVFLHWGVENSSVISDVQRQTAQKLVDAGADIIIGTHPHVLRDIEILERSDGSKAVVAYSLGNLIGAQYIPQTMIGGLLKFDIIVNSETRQVEFENVHIIPIITHYDRSWNIRIYLLEEYTAELAALHGVRAHGRFDMDYVEAVFYGTISEEFIL